MRSSTRHQHSVALQGSNIEAQEVAGRSLGTLAPATVTANGCPRSGNRKSFGKISELGSVIAPKQAPDGGFSRFQHQWFYLPLGKP